MLELDYIHAICLAGIALYIWLREPPRLLLTPLMLISFFVLYGVGNIIYSVVEADDLVPGVRATVTRCLILMWIGLVIGIEWARLGAPSLNAKAELVIRRWRNTPITGRPDGNQLLAALGVVVSLIIFGVFFYLGKLSQLRNFLSFDLTHDKMLYRAEFAGGGGYFYQTLFISVAPFVSFLLLVKGIATRQRYLTATGLLVCAAVFAGKLGTFQKVPWLVYLLQLMAVFQVTRRLELGLGRILIALVVLVAGASLAALIAIPDLEPGGIIEWLGYRFFQINNEVVYQTYYVYPEYLPHTWGMNIGLIHELFGSGELVSAHSRVASFWGSDGATYDSFFIGDAWVDFGYAGVIVLSLLVGYVVKAVDIFILSLGKVPLAIALLGSGMYGVYQLQVTSAFTAFFSGGLLLIPILALASNGLFNDLYRGAGRRKASPEAAKRAQEPGGRSPAF